jgi:hypothetical protein
LVKIPKLFLSRFERFWSRAAGDEADSQRLNTVPHGVAKGLAAVLAPLLARWAKRQEQRILRDGVKLSAGALAFAESLGIERADGVRVLVMQPIPLPAPWWLVRWARRCRLPVFAPGGMALGRGIFLLPGQEDSLPHELVHVLQYQRLGGIEGFMKRYLVECLVDGYAESALEREARSSSSPNC